MVEKKCLNNKVRTMSRAGGAIAARVLPACVSSVVLVCLNNKV